MFKEASLNCWSLLKKEVEDEMPHKDSLPPKKKERQNGKATQELPLVMMNL